MPQKDLEIYVGQVLDDKYRLERLLGQGGMGAVFLATHLGTERYVALKLIAPQFMRNPEFVERFKREARAAGRLRHPNVVDVTDFGFAHAGTERLAYLVMEYLDGCTLSDVLSEEERLPLYWVADILEQVCSAVHEAHQQGIVHRDLKPDNIWLEPTRLGGYRVKVLDFGIAKLGEAEPMSQADMNQLAAAPQSSIPRTVASTAAYASSSETKYTPDLESATLVYADSQRDAGGQAPGTVVDEDGDPTRLYDLATLRLASLEGGIGTDPVATDSTSGLTRVGAILGTPLYMSPEQCRGESLDARSDIYSLGVITYQMLAGAPPFAGDSSTVLRAHNETAPTPLREHDPKLRKRVAAVIMSALAKDPLARPQTAVAFANSLRANADGLGSLYRRAFALYSEYFPTFLKLSLLAHIPVIIVTLLMLTLRLLEKRMHKALFIALIIPGALLQVVSQFLCASIISAVTAIIITQLAVAPMKPVELRSAFRIVRRRWRPFLNTGIRIGLRIMIGWILCVIPGIVMTVRYTLWAPVVLMEGLEKKAARKRARALASRSWRTIILVTLINFLVPAVLGGMIGAITGNSKPSQQTVSIKVGTQLASLVNIFVLPLAYMIPALLYLKMRQFGGETLNDVMAQVEDVEGERSQWQQRMRTRLTMNTPQSRARTSGAVNSPPPVIPAP